jgi:F-type H+-transporting ATPase subunit gamma
MQDSLEALRNRVDGAEDLQAVVRTMKALSASSITQYEQAVEALNEYYHTVELALMASFKKQQLLLPSVASNKPPLNTVVIVFGTDQGLVGQFNDTLLEYVKTKLTNLQGNLKVWAVGERMRDHLLDSNISLEGYFNVPNSVEMITSSVSEILSATTDTWEAHSSNAMYLFHQRPSDLSVQYEAVERRLLPLDKEWQARYQHQPWPHNNVPEVLGNEQATLSALLREYLFVCLYQSCAESLASENASRLAAMQRADKNIDEMLGSLKQAYHQQRQEEIDSELFDVIASVIE